MNNRRPSSNQNTPRSALRTVRRCAASKVEPIHPRRRNHPPRADEFGTHFVGQRLVLDTLGWSARNLSCAAGSASAAARLVATVVIATSTTTSIIDPPGPRKRSRTSGLFSDSLNGEGSITGERSASWQMRAIVFRMALWMAYQLGPCMQLTAWWSA
jgi:hypothetical protein